MAKLSSTFDAELVAKIAKEAIEGRDGTPAEAVPSTPTEQRKIEKAEGEKMFSELFWSPTVIPDIPVKVYSREDWPTNAQLMIPEVNTH